MHVSQSAMSHTLARLRDTFNDPLFIRTSKGLEPTPRALSFQPKLTTILDEISSLLKPESFDPKNIDTRFRLQAHSFIVAGYLTPFFNQIHQFAPNLIFETHAITEFSYQQLNKGEVDLIISAGHQAPSNLMQRRIVEEDRVCLVDKNHPAIKDWGIDNFLKYPHIKNTLLDGKQDPLSYELGKLSLPSRKISFYADDMLTHAVVLKDSELIATLPRSLAENGSKEYGHVILDCPFDLPRITVKAIWHQRSQNEQMHRWLREQLVLISSQQASNDSPAGS